MMWEVCLSFSNIALDLATLSLNGLGGVGDLVKVDQCVWRIHLNEREQRAAGITLTLLYAHVVHFKMKYFTGALVTAFCNKFTRS